MLLLLFLLEILALLILLLLELLLLLLVFLVDLGIARVWRWGAIVRWKIFGVDCLAGSISAGAIRVALRADRIVP